MLAFLRRHPPQHGRLYRAIEAGFDLLLELYRRTLGFVLRHQAVTLAVFFATMALTIVLAVKIPKGFFPIQDTGMIQGLAEAAQDVSPMEMMRLQRELGALLLRDPDIEDTHRTPAPQDRPAMPRRLIPHASTSL